MEDFDKNYKEIYKYNKFKLDEYLRIVNLPKKLFSGRVYPDAPMHSPLMTEWAEEQYDKVLNGLTIKGHYWNPYMYHFLNFFQFKIPILKNNIPTGAFEVNYPFYCNIDEYIYDIMWEATISGKHIALMGPRGFGKSFFATNIIERRYNFFKNSHCVVSASISDHVDTAWAKIKGTLNAFNQKYPMFAHKTLKNDDEDIKSGVKKSTDMGTLEIGYLSHIEKVLYGHNANKTRSMRPDVQLVEEFGAFPSKGSGSLKNVLNQSEGSHKVGGGIMKTFMMLLGTGGSIDNDDAKDVFNNPDLYNIYPIFEWGEKASGIFIPVHYKYSGTWEKTGTPDLEKGMELELKERERLKSGDDPMKYQNHCQEFPITLREVFLKKGTNMFNQDKIAMQWQKLEDKDFNIGDKDLKPKKGNLEWVQDDFGAIIGVKFKEDGIGPINIIEEVELSDEGEKFKDLYVMGVDSIDQGNLDSSSRESSGSKLAGLVKKRIVDKKLFKSTHNIYVAWYNKRSDDVRDDYDNILKLALYYGAAINLEYTKIGIVSHFQNKNFKHLFMKRPSITSPTTKEGGGSKLLGTTTSGHIIDFGDEKIRDYINDFYYNINISELLSQLRDYQREDRTRFDLVIAMAMCEIADEEYHGKIARVKPKPVSDGMEIQSYYRDKSGKRVYGVKPRNTIEQLGLKENKGPVRWIDSSGEPRWDEDYLKEINEI